MATYTAPTLTNYNDNPPTNDGSEDNANNLVDWDRHIDEIGDPIKNYVTATNTAVSSVISEINNGTWIVATDTAYGADNTGATDAVSGIQAAINAASAAGGGSVFLPAGTYLIGSAVTLAPGVKLFGEGPGSTTLIASTGGITMLNYVAATSQTFFDVSDMTINNGDFASVNGISVDGTDAAKRCSNIRLRGLYLTGDTTNDLKKGIRLDFCANITMSDVFITVAENGIELEMCADTDMTNIKVQNGSGNGFYLVGDGASTANDEGLRMSNCSTNGQTIGVSANGVDFINISSSSFTTCDDGPLIAIDCNNWSVVGSEFAEAGTPAKAGIDIDGDCNNWQIIGNYIFSNNWGIDIDGSYHTIVGNTFEDNTANDVVLTNTTHTIVEGNVCKSTSSSDNLEETGTANYNQIIHNTVNVGVTKTGANSLVGYATTTGDGDNLVY